MNSTAVAVRSRGLSLFVKSYDVLVLGIPY